MAENYMINPELDGSSITWQGGKTGFLLLHGFTATTAEVRPLGEALHAAGHTVSAPLLPGHGTTRMTSTMCVGRIGFRPPKTNTRR